MLTVGYSVLMYVGYSLKTYRSTAYVYTNSTSYCAKTRHIIRLFKQIYMSSRRCVRVLSLIHIYNDRRNLLACEKRRALQSFKRWTIAPYERQTLTTLLRDRKELPFFINVVH